MVQRFTSSMHLNFPLSFFSSWTSKSTLLKQVAKPITEINGFVITCAFDRTGSPDTVIASAFDRFFGESLPCSILDVNDSIRCSIRETLDEHVQ